MKAKIRRLIVQVDETMLEMGKQIDPPTRKALTIAAIATVVAAATCAGCASSTSSTVTRPRAADANYQLIQEPDAGYSPIIDLISGASRNEMASPMPNQTEVRATAIAAAVLTWRFLPG